MKVEEINIGSSHHLLVHCNTVQLFFFIICFHCVRLSLASVLHHYFLLFFLSSLFLLCVFFSSSLPAVCVILVSFVGSRLTRLACCDLPPSRIDPSSFSPHAAQIKTHAIIRRSPSGSEVKGSWPSVCGCKSFICCFSCYGKKKIFFQQ